jgi:DNA-binding GntR family transcriptional regulator
MLEQATPRLRRIERVRFSTLSGRASVAQHHQITTLGLDGDTEAAARLARENWMTLDPLLAPPTPPPGHPHH